VSPDLPFAADGYPVGLRGHSWHAPLLWALPLALACAPVIRWTAAGVAVHLPDAGPLHLRDDQPSADPDPGPHDRGGAGLVVVRGAVEDVQRRRFVAGTALLVHIGRSRLLRRWHGPAPEAARRPAVFWATVTAVVSAGAAALPFQPFPYVLPTQAIRCLLIGCVALVAGAVAVSVQRQAVRARR
jgi:hypothetical protein